MIEVDEDKLQLMFTLYTALTVEVQYMLPLYTATSPETVLHMRRTVIFGLGNHPWILLWLVQCAKLQSYAKQFRKQKNVNTLKTSIF